jgi:hypothetical protein
MPESGNTRKKIVVLAAGAAVALSATAIVLQQQPGTASGRLTSVQSASRHGAPANNASGGGSEWIRVAGCSTCGGD